MTDFQTTVFYLHRHSNPVDWLEAFLESIERHPAGRPYALVVLAKGGAGPGANEAIERFAAERPGGLETVQLLELSDYGFDIHAYFTGAAAVQTPLVLFFNSYSRVLGDNWLRSYERAVAALPSPAMVGATACYEGLKGVTGFPNQHVRSNAIIVERAFWLSLEPPAPEKLACNRFEAGHNGLSRRIEASGGGLGIITRSGELILPERWPDVAVYRVGNQEELLVADNRTADFALSSYLRRRWLARLAWGSTTGVRPAPWPLWLRQRAAWKQGTWPEPRPSPAWGQPSSGAALASTGQP